MITVGLQIPRFVVSPDADLGVFQSLIRSVLAAEQNGFDAAFVMDHFMQLPHVGAVDEPMLEAYTALGAIGARTTSLRLGTLVTGVTHRNPALLAKAVTTLDVVTNGRALLGIGAAWFGAEHEAMGYTFPPLSERFERLEDALRICRAMFDEPNATVAGRHHRVDGAWNVPQPVQQRLPILIGGTGEKKTFRLAAQHADLLNINSSFADLAHKIAALRGHLDDIGRDRSTIGVSCLGSLFIAETAAEADEQVASVLRARGVERDTIADPVARAAMLPRVFAGSPEQVIEQVRTLRRVGLDGVVVNMPLTFDDPATVALAGRTLREAMSD